MSAELLPSMLSVDESFLKIFNWHKPYICMSLVHLVGFPIQENTSQCILWFALKPKNYQPCLESQDLCPAHNEDTPKYNVASALFKVNGYTFVGWQVCQN